jgi:tetratricopeptide (TPR) repeat protein
MGLRLVQLEQGAAVERSPEEWRADVSDVLAAVAAATRLGQPAALRAALEPTAGWSDRQRAYQAHKHAIDIVAAGGQDLPHNGWARLFLEMAAVLLDLLERDPAEPALLNSAGVFLYEVGEATGAKTLFKAALALDPALPHGAKNLAAARERERARMVAPLPRQLMLAARALGARAKGIAAKAKPTAGLTLSLCMIVKDEEEMLPGCLEAMRGAVDEIIIVDTGSTDRTVEIAESFGARVLHFPWNGSFADARNVGLDAASSDWIVYLDADEHVVPEDAAELRTLTGRTWREAFYVVLTNFTGGDDAGSAVSDLQLRMWRNRPRYRFEGRIHEQKTGNMPRFLPERFEPTQIRVLHYGYLKSRISGRDKAHRNIELLLREVKESPTPFIWFNLGSEYLALGDVEQARGLFDRAWNEVQREDSWHQIGYVPLLACRRVKARREVGDLASAREAAAEALQLYPDHTDLVGELALCARQAGDIDEAARLAEQLLVMGDAPAGYSATVGSGTFLALMLLGELRQKQGRRDEAEVLLRRALAEHPSFVAPILPLASLLLERGLEPAAVEAELPVEKPSCRLLFATACFEGGHTAAAEGLFLEVLEKQPSNGVARVGLVESLLSQKRWDDAYLEAGAEPETSPVATIVVGEMLFAAAVAGDVPALAVALGRAETVGGEAAQLELYRAWADLLRGAPAPRILSEGAGAAALTVLEALLRVQEFDAFELLLSLYERTAIAPRERCEQLARTYLRRGYLGSAADVWIAVVGEAPDADALVGLAQIAFADGESDDALDFARQALLLDPGSAPARTIVEACVQRRAVAV